MQPEKRVRCEEPEEPKDVLTIMKRLGAKASGLSPWFWEDELGLYRRNFGFLLFHRLNQLRKAWIEANVKLAEKYGC